MCKCLRSDNNAFIFLLDDDARRICTWRADIFLCQTRIDLETAGERIILVYIFLEITLHQQCNEDRYSLVSADRSLAFVDICLCRGRPMRSYGLSETLVYIFQRVFH